MDEDGWFEMEGDGPAEDDGAGDGAGDLRSEFLEYLRADPGFTALIGEVARGIPSIEPDGDF